MRPMNEFQPSPPHRAGISPGLVAWLIAGSVLLATGVLPLHGALLGWSLPYWLVLAPLMLLTVRDPAWPRRLPRRWRRRAARTAIWN